MAKTTINIKADKDVKVKAQKIAHDLGMPLSTVMNAYLKQFIRTREVHFVVEDKLKSGTKRRLDRLQKDAIEGKDISPSFDSAEDAIRYLRS
ncbi:MAG TPA: hypothetical protein VJI96_03080 [Candidatus Andersenbacteria bacterium]|nr:hypothetical protein [Candidatus Andersenbacteria bacterium]